MSLRARRRRIRAAIALGILVLLAGIAWGIHYVSYLPQFSVQSVSVTGSGEVSPELVKNYVGTILDNGSYHFLSRSNIFLYPRALIERDIVADFPRIDSAKVSRSSLFSTELVVVVTERRQFALWCGDPAHCFEMDEGGFIFAEAPADAASSTIYIFQGGVANTDATSRTSSRHRIAPHEPYAVGIHAAGSNDKERAGFFRAAYERLFPESVVRGESRHAR
jgi:cell division septal protein FtsQ